jgi:hypothetical protein
MAAPSPVDGGTAHRGNRHLAADNSETANEPMGGVALAGHRQRVEGDANPNQRPHAGTGFKNAFWQKD